MSDKLVGNSFDPEGFLLELRASAEAMVLRVNEGLARLHNAAFRVPGETDDHMQYRTHGKPNDQLNELGAKVMLALLTLGLTDEEVGKRMSVLTNSVGVRRRRWGRSYAQKG